MTVADRIDPQPHQHSPEVAAYAQAAQTSRATAADIGVRNCDDDPNWRAAETNANQLFDQALNAGHSYDTVLKAGRKA
jgi:hypothetical protein